MEGQFTAVVYKTMWRYKAIKGGNYPFFRRSYILDVTSLTIDQYCETVGLVCPSCFKKIGAGLCATVESREMLMHLWQNFTPGEYGSQTIIPDHICE